MSEASINIESTVSLNHTTNEINPEQHQKMASLKSLFKFDDQIKEALQKSSPPYYSEIDYGDGFSYEKKLNNNLKQISNSFESLAKNMTDLGLPGDNLLEKSKIISKKAEKDIQEQSLFDFDKLSKIYEKHFSHMKPELIKETSQEMVGYYLFKNFTKISEKAESFNELLHLAHASILSDENLFAKLPQWDTTEKEDGSAKVEYNAYGEENEPAKKIFNYLKEQSNKEQNLNKIPNLLQLLSVDNTIQLMVRDFGHALTIEIDISEPNLALIKYNVPKIFDGVKVNQLPGINKVSIRPGEFIDEGASGKFESSYDDLAKNVFDFILQVPTDSHH